MSKQIELSRNVKPIKLKCKIKLNQTFKQLYLDRNVKLN